MKTTVGEGQSQIGGGALPRSTLPSVTLEMLPLNIPLPEFAARLRAGTPPIIGYIAGGRFKLDLRTIFPQQDEKLFRAIYPVFEKIEERGG
jgi:L-seryl-tRNA(Ser) seleniumtransferase